MEEAIARSGEALLRLRSRDGRAPRFGAAAAAGVWELGLDDDGVCLGVREYARWERKERRQEKGRRRPAASSAWRTGALAAVGS